MSEKIDVLLINPGNSKSIFQGLAQEFTSIEPPVFCGLFASYLRRKGLSVSIFDMVLYGTSPKKTAEVVSDTMNPDLIVIVVYGAQPSASTQNMTVAEELVLYLKFADPNIPIMMTGTHPAALPRLTMEECPDLDFVCDLEGPVTIYKTHEALKYGQTDFSEIPSLWWRERLTNKIIQPKKQEALLYDLDQEMPGIAWDLMKPPRMYKSHNWHSFAHIKERSPYAAIHTSLGCPYSCSFCCINAPFGKPAYRMWSPEVVVEELTTLVEQHDVFNVKFVDEMFVLNPRHVLDLCRGIKEAKLKLNIWAYARVDTVQDKFLEALKEAGVNWLCLGIESASQYVRDGAEKKYGNEEIINTVRRIQKAGINVIGNYIFGLPDDTVERMQETLNLALELNCEYANFYSAMAYPGSQLYKLAVEQGKGLPEKWEDYSQHGYWTLPLANDYCSSKEILAFRDAAFTRYFTDIHYRAMIKWRFGSDVVGHINRMVKIPLKRRILGD